MKRILGVLISSVMLVVTCLTELPVSAKEKYTEYIVPFYSDQTKQKQVVGISNESMLKDGVVLIPLETACKIAGASIAVENDEAVIITRNYVSWCCEYADTDKQYLLVDSNTGKGNFYKSALKCLTESSWSGTSFKYSLDDEGIINLLVDNLNQTKISCKYYDDELYVSFYEFLVMMGVDVDLINHETINEITEFYTAMAEEYSDDEAYKAVISEFDKLFSAGTGYEQFFYCSLGTPIDELYKAYYDSDLMCDLGDYYGDGSVEWANLVNAVENYDGLTKTALAALNLNTDYEDVLINTVTYHGDSEDDNFSKTVDDSVDIIQRLLYVRDFGLSVEEIYRDDSVLETVWRMQEKADNIEPILSSVDDFEVDFSLSPDAISMVYSGLCGAMKNYAKYREMSNLFEGEQYLMKNTILSSDSMASNTTDEARGMFISHILNPMGNVIEMHSNLRNEENSYFNLYRSAAKVQETMNKSSPAAWAAVWGAIDNAVADYVDGLILDAIDFTFFGGMPVSSLVNSGILFCVDGLKNTAYGKEQSQIAELDDYVFIQDVAKDCFKEHNPASENARSSFVLGLKSTILAFESTNAGSSGEIHGGGGRSFDSDENSECKGYVPKELYGLLDQSVTANIDFYNVFPSGCDDLTEMIGGNTDISNLDTTPWQDITLEYIEETTEPTETFNQEIQLSVLALDSDGLSPITNKEIEITLDNQELKCTNSKQTISTTDGSVFFNISMGEKKRIANSKVTLHIDGYKDYILENFSFGNDPASTNMFEAVFEKEILNPANIEFVSADVSEYPIVKLYLRVTDPNTDESIENLLMNSFNIEERFEGGKYLSREVKNAFSLEGNDGLKTALVADKSDSISDYDMDKIQSVMIEFVNSMDFDAGDEAMVIAFDSIVQTMCTFTRDRDRLTHGIENMSTDGRTACYDAIYNAVQNAPLRGGARCVIAFTDGIDNESIHTPEEVIYYANTMQVPLYIIGVGDQFDTYDLKNMANSTNGRYWYIDDLYGLEEIFNQIYMEQQDLYVVEYESDTSVEANAVRDVIVEIDGSGYTADLSTSFTPIISANSTHTSRYELFADDVTWEEANALCIQKGGHLATITDAAEEQELIKMAEAKGLSYVWLGGYTSYDSYNDVFAHWITGEEFSYQNWAAGEPSRQDRDGIPEWYLMLWNIKSLGGWTWNDQRNDPMSEVNYMNGKIGYICEYE